MDKEDASRAPRLDLDSKEFGSAAPSALRGQWVVLTLAISSSSPAEWAWCIPVEMMAPASPTAFQRGVHGAQAMAAALGRFVEGELRRHVCSVREARLDVGRSPHRFDEEAGVAVAGLQIDCYRTDVDASDVPAWVDAGLRGQFPGMPPMQGPLDPGDFGAVSDFSPGSRWHGRHMGLVAASRAALEAAALSGEAGSAPRRAGSKMAL